jgi:hypothetical protein
MSQPDFLAYERNVVPNGQLFSAEFATISLGSGSRMGLVQNVQASYGHSVNARFESGSATLFWQTGQPQGQIQAGRLVGRGGFFSAFTELQDTCGRIIGVRIGLDGEGGCAAASTMDRGRALSFDGVVLENLSMGWSAGGLDINESVAMRAASLRQM